ncbi:MAG: DUF1573 domain-containing protein [Bacteroidales bacterium]|nr:DUF1573 domain-containing protein [Bacteroidales bacterium]
MNSVNVSKVLVLMVFLPFLLSSATIEQRSKLSVKAGIEWVNYEHDFGKIKQNKPVTAEFEFKNPSMVPLLIISVKPECGCTVAEFPKEPIKPGKSGIVYVEFDAKIPGFFQKSVTVTSNTEEGTTTLVLKGEVVGNSIKPVSD